LPATIVSLAMASLMIAQILPAAATGATWGAYDVAFSFMAFGRTGTTYASDCMNARVYRISSSRVVSVIAGTGPGGFTTWIQDPGWVPGDGYSGDGGPALDAEFRCPQGLAFDAAGNLYVADHLNDVIRRIDAAGIVTTVAGTGPQETYSMGKYVPGVRKQGGDGGPATKASLDDPWGITFDTSGNLYVADRGHDAIRRVDTRGVITTVAGNGAGGYAGDGNLATSAKLDRPLDVAFDLSGNMYIADENNARIRKVDPDGIITTFAGTGSVGCDGNGGPAGAAALQNPNSIAIGPDGTMYVTEQDCGIVRKITPSGTILPFIGNGVEGCAGFDGPAADVQVTGPEHLRVGLHGDVYVSDPDCSVIFRIDTSGTSHLVATGVGLP
jgi:sugar lactone lactonase YvrE